MARLKPDKKDLDFFSKKITEIIDTDGRDIKVIVEEWGVSYEAVRLWMKGTRLPDGGQLLNLKRKLKCSIDSLLTGENKEFDESTAGQSEELKNLCLDLKEILETADEVSIAALKMNMAMIKGAVKDRLEAKKDKQEKIQLEKRVKVLEKKVKEHDKQKPHGCAEAPGDYLPTAEKET